jgi:hypothetical protein
MISRSVFVCAPEGVPSGLQVAPPSGDRYERNMRIKPGPMPIVIAQAVPSDVQSTAGSLWNKSEPTSDRLDWFQVTPPSSEKNCGCVEAVRSLDAATILFVS